MREPAFTNWRPQETTIQNVQSVSDLFSDLKNKFETISNLLTKQKDNFLYYLSQSKGGSLKARHWLQGTINVISQLPLSEEQRQQLSQQTTQQFNDPETKEAYSHLKREQKEPFIKEKVTEAAATVPGVLSMLSLQQGMVGWEEKSRQEIGWHQEAGNKAQEKKQQLTDLTNSITAILTDNDNIDKLTNDNLTTLQGYVSQIASIHHEDAKIPDAAIEANAFLDQMNQTLGVALNYALTQKASSQQREQQHTQETVTQEVRPTQQQTISNIQQQTSTQQEQQTQETSQEVPAPTPSFKP